MSEGVDPISFARSLRRRSAGLESRIVKVPLSRDIVRQRKTGSLVWSSVHTATQALLAARASSMLTSVKRKRVPGRAWASSGRSALITVAIFA